MISWSQLRNRNQRNRENRYGISLVLGAPFGPEMTQHLEAISKFSADAIGGNLNAIGFEKLHSTVLRGKSSADVFVGPSQEVHVDNLPSENIQFEIKIVGSYVRIGSDGAVRLPIRWYSSVEASAFLGKICRAVFDQFEYAMRPQAECWITLGTVGEGGNLSMSVADNSVIRIGDVPHMKFREKASLVAYEDLEFRSFSRIAMWG